MKLPEFISKAQIKPGPLIDSSASFKAISSVFSGIEKQTAAAAQGLAVQESVRRGAVAGEDPAFKPIPDFSPAAQAFNKAALSANKYMSGAEVIDKINNLQQEAEKNISSDSVVEFKKAAAGFSSGLMSTVPAENRPFVQNYLVNRVTNAEHQLQQKLDTRNKALSLDEFERTDKSYQGAMTNSAWNGNEPEAAAIKGSRTQLYRDKLDEGLLSPSQFATYNELNDKEFNVNRTIGAFRATLHSGTLKEPLEAAQKFLKNFDDGKGSYAKLFTPQERPTVSNTMKQQVKSIETQQKIDAASITNDKKDLLFSARNGGDVDPQRLNAIRLSSTDPKFKSFQQDLINAQFENSIKNRAINGTISSNLAMIGELSKPLTKEQASKPGISKLAQTRGNAVKDVMDINKRWNKDPAGAAKETDEYKTALEKTKEMPELVPNLFLPRIGMERQRIAGVKPENIKVLSLNDKASLIQQINSGANFSDRVATLEKIVDSFGELGGQVAQELSTGEQKIDFQAPMVLSMKQNFPSKQYALTTIRAFESKKNDLEIAVYGNDSKKISAGVSNIKSEVSKNLATWGDTIRGSTLPSAGLIKSVDDSALKLALQLKFENKGMSDIEAAKIASDAMINNQYHLDVSYNGTPYRIPKSTSGPFKNLDKSFVEAAVHVLGEDAQRANLKVPPHYYGPTVSAETARKRYLTEMVGAKGLHFINTKNGLIAADKKGGILENADNNQKFSIRWGDLTNPESALYKRTIAEIEREKSNVFNISSEIPLIKGILSGEKLTSSILGSIDKTHLPDLFHNAAINNIKFRSVIKPRNEADGLLLALVKQTGIPILSQIPSLNQVKKVLEDSSISRNKIPKEDRK